MNNTMIKVALAVGRTFTFATMRIPLYYMLSRVWRALFQRRWVDRPIRRFTSLADLSAFLRGARWVQDPWWRDVFDAPAFAENRYDNTGALGDCDEFAAYAARAVNGMADPALGQAHILTVTYFRPRFGIRGFGGHNVCVFQWQADGSDWAWANISNWDGAKVVKYDDSRMPFRSIEDVVKWVCDRAGGINVGWALVTPDLKLERYGCFRHGQHPDY